MIINKEIETPFGKVYLYHLSSELNFESLEKFCHPEEVIYAKKLTSNSRKKEFLISRYLLRKKFFTAKTKALLNHPEEGFILWPSKISGTISHKKNSFAFFVKEKKKPNESYGIDLEEIVVTEKIHKRISSTKEIDLFKNLQRKHDLNKIFCWSLCFSAKESLFKTFAPLYGKKGLTIEKCLLEEINFKTNSFTGSLTHPEKGKVCAKGFFYQIRQQANQKEMIICLSQLLDL